MEETHTLEATTATAAHTEHPEGLLASTDFWYTLAFVLFVALLGRKIYAVLTAMLDKRGQEIGSRIEEARKLREEGQKLLATYKQKQKDALAEAESLLEDAKKSAKALKAEALRTLDTSLEQRQTQALQKIRQAEKEALHEIQGVAADIAIAAARELIVEKLTPQKSQEMTQGAIESLKLQPR